MSLIDGIYDALDDDEAYAALPRTLADAVGARSATVQIIRDGIPIEVASAYFSAEMGEYYLAEEMFKVDIWNATTVNSARFDQALSSDDAMDRRQFADSAFYNDFFRVFGDDTGVCLGAVIRIKGGHIGLGLHRGMTAQEYDAQHVASLSEALPHLRRVVETRGRIATANTATAQLKGALDAMAHSVMMTDARGHLRFANAAAEALLRAGSTLKVRSGRVVAIEPAAQARLAGLIANASSATGERGGAVSLPGADGVASYRALITPHRVDAFVTGALILIDQIGDQPSNLAEIARALYGLSRAEAGLAQRLVAGETLQEAAFARDVSLGTVQTQLKSIRSKTNTRRQAELASLLASLPRLSER